MWVFCFFWVGGVGGGCGEHRGRRAGGGGGGGGPPPRQDREGGEGGGGKNVANGWVDRAVLGQYCAKFSPAALFLPKFSLVDASDVTKNFRLRR